MSESTIKALVLHANYTKKLSYYDDWLDAFIQHPGLQTVPLNICSFQDRQHLKKWVRETDLIVLLHSTNGDTTQYLEPIAGQLAQRSVPLVSFVGNEVNIPSSPIADKRRVLGEISPEYIASQLMLDAANYLWGDIAIKAVISLPHALNPDVFSPTTPWAERRRAIGVKAVQYSVTLGDDDRNHLHDVFAGLGQLNSLPVEISSTRLSRREWAAFLNDCRATVSSEAGSWYLERDDATVRAISEFAITRKPKGFAVPSDGIVRRIGHKMPWGVRQAFRRLTSGGFLTLDTALIESLDRNEVQALFFNRPKPSHYGKCISSRHFDAIGTGTVQILLEGRYNDCLDPGQHYLQLKQDFSNLDDVLQLICDEQFCSQLSEDALSHVLANHTYRNRIDDLLAGLSA
jgi:hypothetical protein